MITEEVEPEHHLAADVPRLRDRLHEGWAGGHLDELLRTTDAEMHLPWTGGRGTPWPRRQVNLREWRDFLLEQLPRTTMYYVTPEMTALVVQAAQAMPRYEVHPDRLPSQSGFVVFGDTMCDVPREVLEPGQQVKINAAIWAHVSDTDGGRPGLMVVTLQDTGVLLTTQPMNTGGRRIQDVLAAMRTHLGALSYHEEYVMPYGTDPYGEGPREVRNQAVAAMICTWSLMTQRITVTSDEKLPRAVRRHYSRQGLPEPAVRTTTLRQAGKAVQDVQERDPASPGRVYTKRWVVAGYGYWRDTWYPSRQRHEQQFVVVPSYVKGPKDAPLIGGERVNVLRR